MIYFDNAATTKYKPEEVYDAVNFYLREVGVSPGRGSYLLGINATRMLYKSRCSVGSYFGMSKPEKVVFTKNSTEAMNLFFNGYLTEGDHVIISCYEHNAVLRPIQKLKDKGVIDYSVISREDLNCSPQEIYGKYVRENTKVLAVTLASNLTGRIIYSDSLSRYFHERGICVFLDSSQGAGKMRINMKNTGIDFLAFTGHKDLMAIPGIGGLCCESAEQIFPLIQGGTGIHGENYVNPDIFPEGLEAGTLNMPAIWSLQAAIKYIDAHFDEISSTEKQLMEYLITQLSEVQGVTVYDLDKTRVSTCCFNKNGITSDKMIAILDKNGICARGGLHCAILAHEAIETVKTGAVRISLNYRNTMEEVDTLIKVVKEAGD